MNLDKFNEKQLDALKELGNIGAAHAATALSQMIGHKIEMTVPTVNLVKKSELEYAHKGEEKPGVAIYTDMFGKITGKILIFFEYNNALSLIKILMGKNDINKLTEVEESALKEVGNILASSYLNAISTIIDGVLLPSIPSISLDSLSGILSYFSLQFKGVIQNAIWIKTELLSEDQKIVGDFFLFPKDSSLDIIFNEMNVK